MDKIEVDKLEVTNADSLEILRRGLGIKRVETIAWAEACPPGDRREFTERVADVSNTYVVDRRVVTSLLAQARAAWGRDVFAEHHGDGLWRVHQSHREYVVGMGKTEDDALRSAIEGAPPKGEG